MWGFRSRLQRRLRAGFTAPEDRLAPDARDQNDPPEKYDFDVTLTVGVLV